MTQYITRGDSVNYLTNVLASILDFINKIATNISEKFTGEDSGAALVMLIFYLIALILILLLLKGLARVIKDFFRTIFCRQKKKTAPVKPADNGATNSNNEETQLVDDSQNKKRIKNSDEFSLIVNFGNKKYIDDLSNTLIKINEFDNCAFQSQHISTTIPFLSIANEDNIVLSKKEIETINQQVENKSLSELKALLKQANSEEIKIDDAVKSLNTDLSKVMKERDKLAQKELTAIEQHNNVVDALATLCDELTTSKTDLLKKHSELFDFITSLGDKKAVLLDSIKEFKKDIASVSKKTKGFDSLCEKEFKNFVRSFQQQEELLAGCKKNCKILSESRNKIDEDISAIQQKQSKAAADRALHAELVSALTAKINELEELERERLAKEEAERKAREEAERLERERLAREEAERLEREHQAKLEAERLEKERLAKEEAERKAREETERKAREEAERLERERLAKLEAERLEKERFAKLEADRLEKERLAKEETERLERERQAKLEAERLEKERLAKEEAERLERERLEKLEAERLEKERLAKEDAEKISKENVASNKELNEIKEQIKRQQQSSYSINYEDISPEMLEKMAIAEQKKRKAAEKAARLNGKSINEPEPNEKEGNAINNKPNETEDKNIAQNEVKSQDEAVPQTDYFAELKRQWALEEANKKRWEEEKARRKEEEQRRKKELAEKLSGNGASDNNE